MKKYLQFGVLLVLLLWLAGILIHLNPTEAKLTAAAKALLADPEGTGRLSLTNPYQDVRVSFSGQEATLRGVVTSQSDKDEAVRLIAEKIRIDGWLNGHLNPVTAVHSDALKVDADEGPRPKPWFILSLYGGHQRLDGLIGDADQRVALIEALAAKLPAPAVPLNSQVMIDPKALTLDNWQESLDKLPDIKEHPNDRSLIVVGAGDGTWTQLPPEAPDEAVAAALKGAAPPASQVSAALRRLRDWKYPTAEELEKQRQEKAAAINAAAAKFANERAAAEAAAQQAQPAPVPPAPPAPAPTPVSPAPAPPAPPSTPSAPAEPPSPPAAN